MTNNKRKYGNDKFQSGPLSDQPEINTGLLPGSQEVYVESNVDKSTKSSFLKDIPNWLKWLLLAALLLLAFWVWNNRSTTDTVATSESTTTTVLSPTTTLDSTRNIIDPLDPDYYEPIYPKAKRYLDEVRKGSWTQTNGTSKQIDESFSDFELFAIGTDACNMARKGWVTPRIIDSLVGSAVMTTENKEESGGYGLYSVYASNLVYAAHSFLCPEVFVK